MKDNFPGYYPLTEGQMKVFLSSAIIVFDVSALLDLYRIEESLANKVLEVFKNDKIKNRLWIPYDVARLYHQLMNVEIINQMNNINSSLSHLKSCKDMVNDTKSYPYLPIDMKAKLEKIVTDVEVFCNKQKTALVNQLKSSSIKSNLGKLFNGKMGKGYTDSELENIYKEANERFAKLQPPGYLVADLSDNRKKYHDLIIWKQILAYAKDKHKDIILVTGKIKEDWYYVVRDEEVVPRQEMVNEFMKITGNRYYSFSLYRFVEKCHTDLDINIPEYATLVGALREKIQYASVQQNLSQVVNQV